MATWHESCVFRYCHANAADILSMRRVHDLQCGKCPKPGLSCPAARSAMTSKSSLLRSLEFSSKPAETVRTNVVGMMVLCTTSLKAKAA